MSTHCCRQPSIMIKMPGPIRTTFITLPACIWSTGANSNQLPHDVSRGGSQFRSQVEMDQQKTRGGLPRQSSCIEFAEGSGIITYWPQISTLGVRPGTRTRDGLQYVHTFRTAPMNASPVYSMVPATLYRD